MPNYCNCGLLVVGEPDQVADFVKKAQGKATDNVEVLDFNNLVPKPEQFQRSDDKYMPGEFDWEINNWGCKWGACDSSVDVDEGRAEYCFDTAWSPPLEGIKTFSKRWPTLTFVLNYEEPGMCFKGVAKAKNGTLEDHCVEY